MDKKKIILVDDNPANLTACKKVLKDLYDVFPLQSAEKMFEMLTKITPDLILLDVEMPVMNGYEAMRRLKEDKVHKEIPVIFLSAMDDAQSEMEGLDLGAVDYIHKPFVSGLLLKRIETHITLIEDKKELLALTQSIDELLKPKAGEAHIGLDAEDEALRKLLEKERILTRMGHAIRTPLTVIIDMIEACIVSNDINEIKQYLGKADIESRLIMEIINDAFE